MRMLSVPEGTWSGASGVPAPHLMRGERGSVPASRSARREIFECWSADATENLATRKRAFLVTAYDWCGRTKKNLIFFALLNANGSRS